MTYQVEKKLFGMENKTNSKYVVIVKISEKDFHKYHVRNLIKFCQFLDEKHSEWRWFNVFDKNRTQVASFTKKNRPVSPYVAFS
jgi:predicted DNA-binding protein (MmcQ/YjbR family)